MTAPLVALCTDFGLSDPYVGEMKAALHAQWARYPDLGSPPAVIDLCHDVPPGDVSAGAYVLARGARALPPGSVILAVVDPGVGTARPAVAAEGACLTVVGPGNGLFAKLLEGEDPSVRTFVAPPAWDGRPLSATFHGRDLFAPAAAHLAAGLPLAALGEAGTAADLGALPARPPGPGRVVWIDRFGNAITDAAPQMVAGRVVSLAGRTVAGPFRTYGEAPADAPFWYVGSGGTVEFALRDGNGARTYGWQIGMAVTVAAP